MTQVVSLTVRRHLAWLPHLPPGWHELYQQLAERLAHEHPKVQVTHAGAKAAMLQVLLSGGSAETSRLTYEAMLASAELCEVCGAPARLLADSSGYYRTLCPAHSAGFDIPPRRRR